jgi:hypothetical protein
MAVTLQQMLVSVAVRCDGAHDRDDMGFSAADTREGRALAFIPVELWGRNEVELARQLALKYKGQHGHDTEEVEEAYIDTLKHAEGNGVEFSRMARKLERIVSFEKPGWVSIRFGTDDYDANDFLESFGAAYKRQGIVTCPLTAEVMDSDILKRITEDSENNTVVGDPVLFDRKLHWVAAPGREVEIEKGIAYLKFPYADHLTDRVKDILPVEWVARRWQCRFTPEAKEALQGLADECFFQLPEGFGELETVSAAQARQVEFMPEGKGGRVIFTFPMRDKEFRFALKDIGARFDGERKEWWVNVQGKAAKQDVENVCAQYDIEVPAEVKALKLGSEFRMERSGPKDVDLYFPYKPALVGKVKDSFSRRKFAGGQSNPHWSIHVASTEEADMLATIHRDYGFESDFEVSEIKDVVSEDAALRAKRRQGSRRVSAEVEVEGLGGELRPFQKAGVGYVRNSPRSIIGDEMGLGKTVQAIAAIKDHDALPAIVVSPAGLCLNWKREIEKWLPGTSVAMKAGDAGDITVLSYEMFTKNHKALGSANPKAVIFDESHYLKNPKAKRSAAAKAMVEGCNDLKLRLMLTGTPVENRPYELLSQLEILGVIEDMGGSWNYLQRYCDAVKTDFGWDFSGASNTAELNDLLRETCYIRRRKDDVLKELPPKQRSYISVPLSNRKAYDKAAADIIQFLKDEVLEGAYEPESVQGMDEEEYERHLQEQLGKVNKASRAEVLVSMNKLRTLAAEGKVKAIQNWCADFLEGDGKLVVFAEHIDMQKKISESIPGAIWTRDTSRFAKPDEAVRQFQEDDETRVIVCSMKGDNTGHTMTKSSTVLMAEQWWNPSVQDQAEDRTHRIGQESSVNVYYILGENSIDEDMAELIEAKRAVTQSVTDGGEPVQQASILNDLIARMTGRTAEVTADEKEPSEEAIKV